MPHYNTRFTNFKFRLLPLFTALGIYSTWYQINQCKLLADSMQDEAFRVAEQRDEMEKMKKTEIDPLWVSVQSEVIGFGMFEWYICAC